MLHIVILCNVTCKYKCIYTYIEYMWLPEGSVVGSWREEGWWRPGSAFGVSVIHDEALEFESSGEGGIFSVPIVNCGSLEDDDVAVRGEGTSRSFLADILIRTWPLPGVSTSLLSWQFGVIIGVLQLGWVVRLRRGVTKSEEDVGELNPSSSLLSLIKFDPDSRAVIVRGEGVWSVEVGGVSWKGVWSNEGCVRDTDGCLLLLWTSGEKMV